MHSKSAWSAPGRMTTVTSLVAAFPQRRFRASLLEATDTPRSISFIPPRTYDSLHTVAQQRPALNLSAFNGTPRESATLLRLAPFAPMHITVSAIIMDGLCAIKIFAEKQEMKRLQLPSGPADIHSDEPESDWVQERRKSWAAPKLIRCCAPSAGSPCPLLPLLRMARPSIRFSTICTTGLKCCFYRSVRRRLHPRLIRTASPGIEPASAPIARTLPVCCAQSDCHGPGAFDITTCGDHHDLCNRSVLNS